MPEPRCNCSTRNLQMIFTDDRVANHDDDALAVLVPVNVYETVTFRPNSTARGRARRAPPARRGAEGPRKRRRRGSGPQAPSKNTKRSVWTV